MNLMLKKVTKRDHWNNCEVVKYLLPGEEVTRAVHLPSGIPTEEVLGEELIEIQVPDGSELYVSIAGEICVRIPDPAFRDGMCLSLFEAACVFAPGEGK